MRRQLPPIATVLFFLSLPASVESRTWYVKVDGTGDAPTIRAGIDSAQAGDDVLVGPGTYTWTSEGATGVYGMIMMKAGIWLHSEAGPEVTVLDAESQASVIWCSGLSEDTVIEGLTITGGYRDALANDGGGGIHCSDSRLTITDNIVTDNVAQNMWGGAGGAGVFCADSPNALIANNVIIGNTSANYGGGIAINSSPTITGNTVVENSAEIQGGGIDCRFYTGAITINTIVGNSAPEGPGINCEYSSTPLISRNIITASLGGPTFHCDASSAPVITCNDFWNNEGGDGNCAQGAGNFSADPMFCDAAAGNYHLHQDSPCAPDNSPAGCGLVGALPVACGPVPVEQTTWGRIKCLYK
jgi:hypothetical protein